MRCRKPIILMTVGLFVLYGIDCITSNCHAAQARSDAQSRPASGQPFTRPATRPIEPPHPVPRLSDLATQPSVSVSILASEGVPQGWPLLVHATVSGAEGHPITFARDGVTLSVSDSKGQSLKWPFQRAAGPATQAATATAEGRKDVSFAWILADTSTIPLGSYTLAANLDGAVSHSMIITIVAPPAKLNGAQETELLIIKARSAIAGGDPTAALSVVDERLKKQPRDIVALHLKGDALAALGRKKDALQAYRQALTQFALQNPKPPEPPTALMDAIQALEEQP